MKWKGTNFSEKDFFLLDSHNIIVPSECKWFSNPDLHKQGYKKTSSLTMQAFSCLRTYFYVVIGKLSG